MHAFQNSIVKKIILHTYLASTDNIGLWDISVVVNTRVSYPMTLAPMQSKNGDWASSLNLWKRSDSSKFGRFGRQSRQS